jgi:hypothetical protein
MHQLTPPLTLNWGMATTVEQQLGLGRFLANAQVATRGTSDDAYTPDWVLTLAAKALGGIIDLDPCADPQRRVPARRHFTLADDGLSEPWHGTVWLNPPYSDTTAWLKHLHLYLAAGKVTQAIALLPVSTLGNKGAVPVINEACSAYTVLEGRLTFLDADYRPHKGALAMSSVLLYFGADPDRFLSLTMAYGIGSLVAKRKPAVNYRKQCEHCGGLVESRRSTAKFCGNSCRVSAHQRRKREQCC